MTTETEIQQTYEKIKANGGRAHLCIEMLSDWHVGDGTGQPGWVDRKVALDRDGLPFIPAKSITGILRDACETVANAGYPNDKALTLLNMLFGQDRNGQSNNDEHYSSAAISIRTAFLTGQLADCLRKSPHSLLHVRNALTFVQPGIRIEENSGQALDDHLRFIEMARLGMRLEAEIQIDFEKIEKESHEDAVLLFEAGVSFVDCLGAARRRGAGQCRIRIETNCAELNTESPESATTTFSPTDTLLMRLELIDPISIPARTVGNIGRALPYIPGTFLMGAVAQLTSTKEFWQAVKLGDLRFLPAYLDIGGVRSTPVPFCLCKEKAPSASDTQQKAYNNLLHVSDDTDSNQMQAMRGTFCAYDPTRNLLTLVNEQLRTFTHNTISDEYQRPTSDVGGIYTYEALSAGTIMRSEIRCASLSSSIDIKKLDGAVITLGRSKKDNYGRVRISIETSQSEEIETSHNEIISQFTLYCASPVLVRNKAGQLEASGEAIHHTIQKSLGIDADSIQIDKAFLRACRLESWHRKWSLPRPSLVGIAAGSCIAFTAKNGVETSKLMCLQTRGLGERCGEGFGDIYIDSPLLNRDDCIVTSYSSNEIASTYTNDRLGDLKDKELEPFTQAVRRAAWTTWITTIAHSDAKTISEDIFKFSENKPTNTQMGDLRQATREMTITRSITPLVGWLRKLQNNPSRDQQTWPEGFSTFFDDLLNISVSDDLMNELKFPAASKRPDALRCPLAPYEVLSLVFSPVLSQSLSASDLGANKEDLPS